VSEDFLTRSGGAPSTVYCGRIVNGSVIEDVPPGCRYASGASDGYYSDVRIRIGQDDAAIFYHRGNRLTAIAFNLLKVHRSRHA
jgi:hypothetical protein